MQHERQTGAEQENRELVDSLRRILEAQLAAGREGNLTRVEQLGGQANAVVRAIVQRGGIAGAEPDGACGLKKLYGELIPLVQAQQADVQSRLRQVRRVKRAVAAYGGNDGSARKSSSRLG